MKARNKFMDIIIAILAVIVLVEAVIIAGIYSKCKNTEKALREYKEALTDLSNIYDRAVTARNTAEKLNVKYMTENKRLVEELYLAQNEIERLNELLAQANAAITQQEEPEMLPQSSKITWSLDRLPEGKTNTYRCMDYRKITDKTSDQYILQNEDFTFSDTDTGLRFSIIDGEKYYHAALATAYGIDIGNTWHVTLDTGYELNVIHAEYKHPIDDPRADDFGDPDVNYAGDRTTSVIEFVYDWEAAPQEIIDLGGMFIEDFGGKDGVLGNIVEMKPTGRKWEP